MYAQTHIPDARRSDPSTYRDEATALLRIIREQCPGPNGERPTMQQIAELLGMADSTLYAYGAAGQRGTRRARLPAVPFPVLYALRVMVTGLPATRAALWGTNGTG